MREIKFRVWLTSWKAKRKSKTMVNVPLGQLSLLDVNPDAVLMQYTGLKDKNGIEIYEGDIVQLRYGPPVSIEYQSITAGIGMRCTKERALYIPAIDDIADFKKEAKIIGNIYENPELLEDDNEKT